LFKKGSIVKQENNFYTGLDLLSRGKRRTHKAVLPLKPGDKKDDGLGGKDGILEAESLQRKPGRASTTGLIKRRGKALFFPFGGDGIFERG
jgi:hypothetical protein